jgi:hypothetical protein
VNTLSFAVALLLGLAGNLGVAGLALGMAFVILVVAAQGTTGANPGP